MTTVKTITPKPTGMPQVMTPAPIRVASTCFSKAISRMKP